jgi:parallel beta-helix repeat protein
MLFHAISNENGTFEAYDNAEENAPESTENTASENREDGFSVENTADIVLEMNAIDSVKAGTFNKLVNVALHCVGNCGAFTPASVLAEHLDLAEEAAITQTVAEPERYAKGDKAGKIKTARYLSKTYQHARSTLVNFLENGGTLVDDDGNLKGKSAIEAEKKEARAPKSPEEKLAALAQTVKALLDQCEYRTDEMNRFINEIRG